MATSMGAPPQRTDPDRPGDQAGERFTGGEGSRFSGLIIAGLLLGAAVIAVAWIILGSEYAIPLVILAVVGLVMIVAFVVDTDYGIPVLLLLVICAVAAIGFRVIAGRGGAIVPVRRGAVRR